MGERFYVPRICKYCGNPFIGRDRKTQKATYCSRACCFHDNITREHQIKAGRLGGLSSIKRLRGTGTKTYVKEYGRHQHRVVMERILGRKLKTIEIVHHIDGNKKNNDPKNLMLLKNQAEHASLHMKLAKRQKNGQLISPSKKTSRP